MQNFSPDLCMKYADFKIHWNLISETMSDGTTIREYEAEAPVKRWKYHKRVTENKRFTKSILQLRFPNSHKGLPAVTWWLFISNYKMLS